MDRLSPGDIPRMIKVEQKLDSLHIQLPRRHSSGKSVRQNTFLVMAAFALLGTCGSFSANMIPVAIESSSAGLLLIPVLILLALAPYIAFVVAIRRASASGEVVLTQRMLRMEGRKALELPLEEVQRIEIITEGDRGRLRFHTTQGPVELFDGLFHHELSWLHRTIDEHTGRLREQMQLDGHDTDVAARPPEALTRLVRQ